MAEFSEAGGYSGEGKYCIQCTKECDYIDKDDDIKNMNQMQFMGRKRMYYECTTREDPKNPKKTIKGCKRVYCDEC